MRTVRLSAPNHSKGGLGLGLIPRSKLLLENCAASLYLLGHSERTEQQEQSGQTLKP